MNFWQKKNIKRLDTYAIYFQCHVSQDKQSTQMYTMGKKLQFTLRFLFYIYKLTDNICWYTVKQVSLLTKILLVTPLMTGSLTFEFAFKVAANLFCCHRKNPAKPNKPASCHKFHLRSKKIGLLIYAKLRPAQRKVGLVLLWISACNGASRDSQFNQQPAWISLKCFFFLILSQF